MKALAFIRAAVRKAIGQPILPILARRAHQAIAATEAQKRRQAESKLPQPMRLWLLARRKRECRKRRHGDSAKSPAANRKRGTPRCGRPVGLNTYAERDRYTSELLEGGARNSARIARERYS